MMWFGCLIALLSMLGIQQSGSTPQFSAVKCEEWMEHQVDPFIVYYPPLGRFVRCNTYRANGGWIVVQYRRGNRENFDRTWEEYKKGFGHIMGNHWLGLEALYNITNNGVWELRIDFEDNGRQYYAYYSKIRVSPESDGYRIRLWALPYSGNVYRDHRMGIECSNGTKFSTKDRDNDGWRDSCSHHHRSGWWHSKPGECGHDVCTAANINGLWRVEDDRGTYWRDGRNDWTGGFSYFNRWFYFSEMKIRRHWYSVLHPDKDFI